MNAIAYNVFGNHFDISNFQILGSIRNDLLIHYIMRKKQLIHFLFVFTNWSFSLQMTNQAIFIISYQVRRPMTQARSQKTSSSRSML
jgi:hypothetical protein